MLRPKVTGAAFCGWCNTNNHRRCRPKGDGWTCACHARGHKPAEQVTR